MTTRQVKMLTTVEVPWSSPVTSDEAAELQSKGVSGISVLNGQAYRLQVYHLREGLLYNMQEDLFEHLARLGYAELAGVLEA